MSRAFQDMHPLIKTFVTLAMRKAITDMGEGSFTAQDFEDMRAMLIAGAKATIDVEMERKNRGATSGIVLAGPGALKDLAKGE